MVQDNNRSRSGSRRRCPAAQQARELSHSVYFCVFSDPCKEEETIVVMAVRVSESQTSLACKLKTSGWTKAIDVLAQGLERRVHAAGLQSRNIV